MNIIPREALDQIAIFQWLSYIPEFNGDCHHVPNEGKRSFARGKMLKKMGLTAGFSDIFIAIPSGEYHGLFIELKSKRADGRYGVLSESQNKFIERKNKRGYYATACYGIDDTIETIKKYLGLHKD